MKVSCQGSSVADIIDCDSFGEPLLSSEAESAFAALYGRYEPQIYAYCRRRFAADVVEDVLADVFLTAWRKIDSAPSGEEGLRWLYRIAYLTASNHRRGFTRRSKLVAKLESTGVTFEPPVVDQVVVRDEVSGALASLDSLRPGDREIIRLSVWEHLSNEEISEVLSISPEAATQRLHRARKRLARDYESKNRNRLSPAALEGGEW